MVGAARAKVTRERARMGLINFIVFAVSQSVEERITLLGGGGQVALLYTLLDITRTWQSSPESRSEEDRRMFAGAKEFDPFNEIFGSVARHI